MIASLKKQGLYEVSIGLGKESYEYENDWQNDYDRDFGAICMVISPRLCYLIDSAYYPKDLWKKLDRTFGNHNEDYYINLERLPAPQEFFLQKYWTLFSLIKNFKRKKK